MQDDLHAHTVGAGGSQSKCLQCSYHWLWEESPMANCLGTFYSNRIYESAAATWPEFSLCLYALNVLQFQVPRKRWMYIFLLSKFRPKNRLFYWKGGCWIIQARCWVHRSELSSKERDHLQHLDQCLWEGWAVAKGIVSRQDILVQVCTQKQIEYTVIVFTAVRLEASFSFSSWSDVCCLTAWRASFIDILVRLFLKQMEHQQVRSNWLALGRASRAILEANIGVAKHFSAGKLQDAATILTVWDLLAALHFNHFQNVYICIFIISQLQFEFVFPGQLCEVTWWQWPQQWVHVPVLDTGSRPWSWWSLPWKEEGCDQTL